VAPSRRTTATALAGITLAALLLTGCSAGSGEIIATPSSSASPSSTPDPESDAGSSAGGQSKADACEVLKTGLTGTIESLQTSMSDMSTDPAAASAAVASLAEAFEETAADVTNEEVRGLADDTTAALNDFSQKIQGVGASPQTADEATRNALIASATEVQTTMGKIGTTCA
jgi:hypothetical protein